MSKISIIEEYKNYLKLLGVEEKDMSLVQKKETRRAFMAGVSTMYVLILNRLPDLPEAEAVAELGNMKKQLDDFWQQEEQEYLDGLISLN